MSQNYQKSVTTCDYNMSVMGMMKGTNPLHPKSPVTKDTNCDSKTDI